MQAANGRDWGSAEGGLSFFAADRWAGAGAYGPGGDASWNPTSSRSGREKLILRLESLSKDAVVDVN